MNFRVFIIQGCSSSTEMVQETVTEIKDLYNTHSGKVTGTEAILLVLLINTNTITEMETKLNLPFLKNLELKG